jgi:predicted nucleic acid-binding protein
MLSKPAVYWDACVFIDWIENQRTDRLAQIRPVIEAAEDGKLLIVTSAWGMAEVVRCNGKNPSTGLDNPLTEEDEKKIVEFFRSPFIEVRALDRMIAQLSRAYVRRSKVDLFCLPISDAVHLATASFYGISTLHTFDEEHLMPLSDKFGTPPIKIVKPGQTSISAFLGNLPLFCEQDGEVATSVASDAAKVDLAMTGKSPATQE